MKKIIKTTLAGLLFGISGCAKPVGKEYKIELNLDMSSAITIEYNKKHVASRYKGDTYERYEHKGFDGKVYCTQVFTVREDSTMIITDWEDGTCDGIPETVTAEAPNGSYTFFCEREDRESLESSDHTKSCSTFKETGLLDGFEDKFRRKNHIDFVLSKWNHYRDSCSEKACYMVLQPPRSLSMSKKKVE